MREGANAGADRAVPSFHPSGFAGGTVNFFTRRGTSDKPTVTVRTGVTAFTENLGESAAEMGGENIDIVNQDF